MAIIKRRPLSANRRREADIAILLDINHSDAETIMPFNKTPSWLWALCTAVLLLLLAGCSTLTLDRVDTDRLTVNVSYYQLPDQIEVTAQMQAGFWNRRVTTGGTLLALEDASGRRLPLEETGERGVYARTASLGNGPYQLILGDQPALALPMASPLVLIDTHQVAGTRVGLDEQLRFEFENPDEAALRWSFSAQCGDDEWRVMRQLEADQTAFSPTLRTVKQQLDRAAGARLTGNIPLRITVFDTLPVTDQAPFRIREARVEDRVDLVLVGPSSNVSVSGRVGIQASPGTFFSVGASTPSTRRCR